MLIRTNIPKGYYRKPLTNERFNDNGNVVLYCIYDGLILFVLEEHNNGDYQPIDFRCLTLNGNIVWLRSFWSELEILC